MGKFLQEKNIEFSGQTIITNLCIKFNLNSSNSTCHTFLFGNNTIFFFYYENTNHTHTHTNTIHESNIMHQWKGYVKQPREQSSEYEILFNDCKGVLRFWCKLLIWKWNQICQAFKHTNTTILFEILTFFVTKHKYIQRTRKTFLTSILCIGVGMTQKTS